MKKSKLFVLFQIIQIFNSLLILSPLIPPTSFIYSHNMPNSKNHQIKSIAPLSINLDGDRKKNDTIFFWFLYPRCIFFFSLILDDLFKLFFLPSRFGGLNNQFTCVFVCHISIHCAVRARYTDLHTSIWCHLFQFFSFFFFFVVVLFFSLNSFRWEIDFKLIKIKRLGKYSEKREGITIAVKWWSRFGFWRGMSRARAIDLVRDKATQWARQSWKDMPLELWVLLLNV